MHRLFAVAFLATATWSGHILAAELAAPGDITPPLTREQAVVRALNSAPTVEAAAARVRAARANLLQAGVLPNPQLGLEVENFGTSRAYRGFSSSEATLSLSQTIEIGGKRGARSGLAAASRKAADYDYAAARLDLAREVRRAFTEAVAAEAELRLAEDRRKLAGEVVRSVKGRVDAGREPVLQQRRSEIAHQQAEIDLKNVSRRLLVARNQLAILTDLQPASLVLDSSWFATIEAGSLVDPDGGAESIELLQRQAELDRSRAEIAMETSRAVPDLTLSAGVRRFQDTDDTAFIAGISIPIPVFDQNRGAITRARENANAAEAELRAARRVRAQELAKAQALLAEARDNAVTLRESIVPAAEQAFRFASEGYSQGKFSYLEVLEAQRALFEARRSQIDALQTFHETQADLERLNATAAAIEEK